MWNRPFRALQVLQVPIGISMSSCLSICVPVHHQICVPPALAIGPTVSKCMCTFSKKGRCALACFCAPPGGTPEGQSVTYLYSSTLASQSEVSCMDFDILVGRQVNEQVRLSVSCQDTKTVSYLGSI